MAGLYMSMGVLVAIVSGWTIGRLRLERHVEGWVFKTQAGDGGLAEERLTGADRIEAGGRAMKEIVGKVWPYVLLGIAVGAGIHGYVPEKRIPTAEDVRGWFAAAQG